MDATLIRVGSRTRGPRDAAPPRACGPSHRDGTVRADCKGFSLKGPYHVPRCLANLTVLLEEYLSRGQALIGGVEGVS